MAPHMSPLGPKALHMDPKGVPRWPKGLQTTVKWGLKHPKGSQRDTKVGRMGSQRWPKTAKGSPGGPNYINKLPINRPSGRYAMSGLLLLCGFELSCYLVLPAQAFRRFG